MVARCFRLGVAGGLLSMSNAGRLSARMRFCLLLIVLLPARMFAQSVTDTARQSLSDAWWTGPIAAAGADTLPPGHVLFEPYF